MWELEENSGDDLSNLKIRRQDSKEVDRYIDGTLMIPRMPFNHLAGLHFSDCNVTPCSSSQQLSSEANR